MRKEVFDQGITILGRQFPEKTFDAEIMYQFLKDLSDEQYLIAIKDIVSTMPELNRAHNIIAIIRDKALCKGILTAGEAWGEVLNQVRITGSYGCPKFSSKVIEKCVNSIGWRNICLSETPMVERAHFLKIYDVIAAREKNFILSDSVKLLVGNVVKKLEARIGK